MTITLTKVKKVKKTLDTSFVSEEALSYYRYLRSEGYEIVTAQCRTDEKFSYPEGTMASFNGKRGAVAKEAKKNFHFSIPETKEEKEKRDMDEGWAIPIEYVDERGNIQTEPYYPE